MVQTKQNHNYAKNNGTKKPKTKIIRNKTKKLKQIYDV